MAYEQSARKGEVLNDKENRVNMTFGHRHMDENGQTPMHKRGNKRFTQYLNANDHHTKNVTDAFSSYLDGHSHMLGNDESRR